MSGRDKPRRALAEEHEPEPRRRWVVPVAVVAATAVVAGGTAVALNLRNTTSSTSQSPSVTAPSQSATSAAPSASTSPRPSATPTAVAPCADAAVLAVEPSAEKQWQPIIAAFGLQSGGSCNPVVVKGLTAAQVAASPQGVGVWLPADSGAFALSGKTTKAAMAGQKPSVIAGSPLVMALPAAVADKRAGKPIAPAEVRALLASRTTMVLPEPTTTLGTTAFAQLAPMAAGTAMPDPASMSRPAPPQVAVIKLSHRFTPAVADARAVIASIAKTPTAMGVTTEQALLSSGSTTVKGVRIGDGTTAVPLAMVALGADHAPTQKALAQFLATPEGAGLLVKAGYHVADQGPDEAALASVGLAAGPAALKLPGAADMAKAYAIYAYLDARASTLLALDLSGSMDLPITYGEATKLQIVQALAGQAYQLVHPQSRSELITFQAVGKGAPKIVTVAPMAENGVPGDKNGSARVTTGLATGDAQGGTPLYAAMEYAYRSAQRTWDPSRPTKLILVTDGRNEDTTDPTTLTQLVATLKKLQDPKKPVGVAIIAVGPDADMRALNTIATTVGGKVFQVKDTEEASNVALATVFA